MSLEKRPASQQEAEKLVHEIQELIKAKGLKVDLVPKEGFRIVTPELADGCTGCTICPCMICW
ncbi:hypothetical protein F11_02465 [Rhodospirillum rubrum F11]|uniref:Uncharacterized protein n=1 Tax=Rhodospirillum rubrum (strain ATCC 11170 / ATH 1.1.1 / DSM 467 / LMG 4362 / NCIMB 8255 / S1) TaxID=269796 RepID=Q2RX60_RHORT|nr:hypothetical protein [Rhodospirillum rubrum]ABC21285.1 hypothetical protein Rru_A0480 [Rhodospirillum rubrum ATCC 11170]AEO46963.1 hypothetical protein F11_02465 [Rhodospirillum rubrum F11]MBK5952839.1 hypothetical protein [Rhodospirillum rubrum]QXG80970.1 hypothetical protein KUL73_02525 [Rhodospirillum rubrum]HAQ00265.1 hypothetical protein [Rhodospirillum rubrum]